MSFEKLIKEWVCLDNKLKYMNDEINSIRERKNNISNNIINYAYNNNIQNKTINISDGNLKFIKTNQYNTLTFKHLEECLHNFISNEDDIKTIIKYIKDTRKKKIVNDIKRSYY
jgi:DNA-binding transcriptional regulator YhcF (GntR family)